jgi:predicted PurR-regulated permease PerM
LIPALLATGVFVVLALLLWRLADVLLLLFGGVIVATALRTLAAPLVDRARVSERVAVLFIVVLIVAAIALFISLVGDRLSEQIENLRIHLPDAFAALTRWLRSHPGGQTVLDMWEGAQQGEVPWARVVNVASSTLGALGAAALVIFVGIYLAVDPRLYRRGMLRLVPTHYRGSIHEAMDASGAVLSKWLMGQSISMLFVGTATAIGLAALGLPLAFSLGIISGVLAFVPFFGALASGVLAVLFAFTKGPQEALYVAILAIAIQQVEGHLLTPLVQRWAAQIPPVLSIMASVVFGLLFGIVGVLFATPLMVVVMTLIEKLYIERFLEREGVDAQ